MTARDLSSWSALSIPAPPTPEVRGYLAIARNFLRIARDPAEAKRLKTDPRTHQIRCLARARYWRWMYQVERARVVR